MKLKHLHIFIIIIGIVFICSSGFHCNIWFDESYSVGMSQRTFREIWMFGGHDVHPVLYYWLLKILSSIVGFFGISSITGKILTFRFFSMIPIIILGILGFTHIRKDFGEKTGLIFSFLVFFLPELAIYANEIRMYSWGILSVSILAIYAYRLTKNSNTKNWVIFFLASIFSIFIHYYGLMAAGLINVFLLIYLIKEKKKTDIIKIISLGIVQLLAYIPWLMYFISQLNSISHGFWIKFTYPDSLMELMSYQLIGNLDYKIGFIISIILYVYLGIRLFKSDGNKKPAILSTITYLSVIAAAIIITFILHSSILYYRYLFIVTGLYIFSVSFIMAKEKKVFITFLICFIILVMSVASNIKMIKDNYYENNMKQVKYLKENIQTEDCLVYEDIGIGSIGTYFSEYKQYFYNPGNWGVQEAYKAFGTNFEIVINDDFVDNLPDRVWVIDDENENLYNEIFKESDYKVVSKKLISTKYHDYTFNLILLGRNTEN